MFGPFGIVPISPAKSYIKRVEPRGVEPLTSAVHRRQDTLQELSGHCKMPAKARVYALTVFLSFQESDSGCCTVAAQALKIAASA